LKGKLQTVVTVKY